MDFLCVQFHSTIKLKIIFILQYNIQTYKRRPSKEDRLYCIWLLYYLLTKIYVTRIGP